jgi:nucleoside-diphosphate-sugar epimerase
LATAFYDRISSGEPFEVWEGTTRYPIDVTDVVRIVTRFLSDSSMWNRKINVALRSFSVLEFVKEIEKIVGKAANYELVPKGQEYKIPTPEILSLAKEMGLDYSENYLSRVLRKYYAQS